MKIIFYLSILLILIPIISAQPCVDEAVEDCSENEGICAGSVRTCYDGIWSACSILPKSEEICDNNLDDNCNGVVDENCICTDDEKRPCQIWNLGVCSASTQTCESNEWSQCDIVPINETCDNLADDDCDGKTDLEDEDCFDSNHCTNRQKDYDEEGVDCGGSLCELCPSCKDGKLSSRLGERKVNVVLEDGSISDCGGQCPACPTCNDGKKNQLEEEVDCGGPNCPSCQEETPLPPILTSYCGDATCDPDEDNDFCPEDCKSSFNFLLYFIIILVLLVILFLIYIFLKGAGPRKKKKLPPLKIHSAFLKPLPKDSRSDKLAEKLRKIR